MLNVNELTSRMAKMSDDQLRQYAQLHKDDPYTLALASSESKRRAQLRAGGQQGAQGQQPTVADQALAQMGAPAPMPQAQPQSQAQAQLPENQGIGMLPAANMAGMADGGIAGYDDEYAAGGIVAFAGDGPSLVGQGFRKDSIIPVPKINFNKLVATQMGEEANKDLVDEIARLENIVNNTADGPERIFAQQRLAKLRGKSPATPTTTTTTPSAYVDSATKPPGWAVAGKKKGEASSMAPPIDEFAGVDLSKTGPYNIKTPAGREAAKNAQTRKAAGKKETDAPTGTSTEPSGFVPTKTTTLNAELERLALLGPGVGAYDVLGENVRKGYENLQKEREASRPTGKPYEGLEALLAKEEEKAKGKEARNFNMAIINAGLAIAGGKSQYALQNIAEGAQVGTKQYQEGLEKLEAAAVERRKQAALIEEARRAEARGDWKETAMFKQQAFEAGIAVQNAKIGAIQDIFKTNLKTASDIVNNQETLAAQDNRALMEQRAETERSTARNITSRDVANIYASARGMYGAGATRGQVTDDDIYKAYNRHVEKDSFGDFQKQFPDFASYRNYVLQQLKNAQGGDPYAGWGELQVTSPKK